MRSRVVCICPFSLDRLTGTPLRAQSTVRALSEFSDVSVITEVSSTSLPAQVYTTGRCTIFSFTYKAFRILRTARPDLVHALTPVAIVPAFLYKVLVYPRVRVIFEVHGWSWYELSRVFWFPKRFIFFCLDMAGLWFSSSVITVSETERLFLQKWTWRPERIYTVWDPVDFDAPYSVPCLEAPLIVGYIGNDAWWQGLSYIIDAARLLAARSDVRFVLAGFPASDTKLFPPLDAVTYLGRVERDSVISFLQSCDILISSRLPERVSNLQFPHKLSEYLAVGRPVITSVASDQPLVVKQAQCGVVVDPLSGETLSRAILSLVELPTSERLAMGERAFTFARENLSLPVLVKKLRHVYEYTLPPDLRTSY